MIENSYDYDYSPPLENQYRAYLIYRKSRFTPYWDFYAVLSAQHWRETFEKAYKQGKSVKVWIK